MSSFGVSGKANPEDISNDFYFAPVALCRRRLPCAGELVLTQF
jgi:hypothetical protein